MQFETPRCIFMAVNYFCTSLAALLSLFLSAARVLMNTRLFLLIYFLMVLLCDQAEMGVNHNIITNYRFFKLPDGMENEPWRQTLIWFACKASVKGKLLIE